jgi:hypothetical protein
MMTPADGLPLPVTPDDLAALLRAILGGVQSVRYADRAVTYMSLADMLKALQIGGGLVAPGSNRPRIRGACFSKGLFGYFPGGPEHAEVADIAWERRR